MKLNVILLTKDDLLTRLLILYGSVVHSMWSFCLLLISITPWGIEKYWSVLVFTAAATHLIFSLICTKILIKGLEESNLSYLKPWTYTKLVENVTNLICSINFITKHHGDYAFMTPIGLLLILSSTYLMLRVRKTYKQFISEEKSIEMPQKESQTDDNLFDFTGNISTTIIFYSGTLYSMWTFSIFCPPWDMAPGFNSIIFILFISHVTYSLLVSKVLLNGFKEKKSSYFKPWLCLKIVESIFLFIGSSIRATVPYDYYRFVGSFGFLVLLLGFYLILCMWKEYTQLKKDAKVYHNPELLSNDNLTICDSFINQVD